MDRKQFIGRLMKLASALALFPVLDFDLGALSEKKLVVAFAPLKEIFTKAGETANISYLDFDDSGNIACGSFVALRDRVDNFMDGIRRLRVLNNGTFKLFGDIFGNRKLEWDID